MIDGTVIISNKKKILLIILQEEEGRSLNFNKINYYYLIIEIICFCIRHLNF